MLEQPRLRRGTTTKDGISVDFLGGQDGVLWAGKACCRWLTWVHASMEFIPGKGWIPGRRRHSDVMVRTHLRKPGCWLQITAVLKLCIWRALHFSKWPTVFRPLDTVSKVHNRANCFCEYLKLHYKSVSCADIALCLALEVLFPRGQSSRRLGQMSCFYLKSKKHSTTGGKSSHLGSWKQQMFVYSVFKTWYFIKMQQLLKQLMDS